MINELNIVYIIDLIIKIKFNIWCFEKGWEELIAVEYKSDMYGYECK